MGPHDYYKYILDVLFVLKIEKQNNGLLVGKC